MTSLLAHRGPDGEGVYLDPRGIAGLGHRRLAVIDTSPAGAEPLSNEDGTIWLTFNGEIYNFRDLRAQLSARGHRFSSHTDAEVVVHLYEDHGVGLFDLLDGMFAFALWDQNTETLFIARDRFGEKPLSYHHDAGRFIFASELKPILSVSGTPSACDESSLPYFFSHNHLSSPHTGFRGVCDLPPAHYGMFRNNSFTMTRYSRLDFSRKTDLAYPDAVHEVRRLLDISVRDRLRADVPVGIFLSGGVDSSAIAALAAQEGGRVASFSAGFSAPGFSDERSLARETADALGLDHHDFSFSPDLSDLVPRLVRLYERPYADSSALAAYCLAERARESVTVVLGGDGGDEAFGGYARYSYWSLLRYLTNDAYEMIASYPYFPRPHPVPALRSLDGVFAHGIDTFLPGDLLLKIDRAGMAHGLEIRSPFLSRALMEFSASLPSSWKAGPFRTKSILKDALSGIVPAGILRAPKRGFEVPVDSWFRGAWRVWASDILLDGRTVQRGYFDRAEIERLLREHASGMRRHGQRIWLLICFELWNREFMDRPTESARERMRKGMVTA